MSARRRNNPSWEGWFFAYELTHEWLRLWWLRCIPVGWVRLAEVRFLRQRSGHDLSRLVEEAVTKPGWSWYWPHPFWMGRDGFDHAPYVLETLSGTRIYIRLKHGFHYRLREAISRARAEDQAE